MKYQFKRRLVVTTLTPTLCHYNCAGHSGHDYPEEGCDIFNARRERSDSEGVSAYKRLPECIETAVETYEAELPKVGDKFIFMHTKTEHAVAEVQAIVDDTDEWKVRLNPPLEGTFSQWVWIAQRYLEKAG